MVVVGCCNRVKKLAYVYTITKVFFLAKNMQLFLMKTTPSLPFGILLAFPQLCYSVEPDKMRLFHLKAKADNI